MPDDLTPPETDVDDVDDDELLPDEADPASTDPTKTPVLDVMRELGPCTAQEIADRLGRKTGNVATRLRQYEEAGKVRRTGRSVHAPGQRGPGSVEWEVMPENGTPTSPNDPREHTAPLGSAEGRIRTLSERVGRLAAELERAESDRDAAKAGAADARRQQQSAEVRLAEQRQQREALERQRSDLEREVERLQTQLDAAAEDADEAVIDDEVATALGLTARPVLRETLLERARQLSTDAVMGPASVNDEIGRLRGALMDAEQERDRLREGTPALDAMRRRDELEPRPDGMTQVYFDFLMELAAQSRDEHVFDRIERLLEGGTHGD